MTSLPATLPVAAGEKPGALFAELKRIVSERGLLVPDPGAHLRRILATATGLVLSGVLLYQLESFALQLVNAVFLGFLFVRCGVINHDACHRDIFAARWKNRLVRLLFGNVLIGLSAGWWTQEHNRHHATPNILDVDPDIAVPHLAFSESQLQRAGRLGRWLARYQALTYLPGFMLQSIYLRAGSASWLATEKSRQRVLESLLVVLHLAGYAALVWAALPPAQALVFVAVHQAAFGFVAGTIFAPGHKGLPIIEEGHGLDYLHLQVGLTRNLPGGWLADWWYAGLNYQVEHHLFPGMSTSRFVTARPLIRDFCAAHGLQVLETTVLATYREILVHLKRVARAA